MAHEKKGEGRDLRVVHDAEAHRFEVGVDDDLATLDYTMAADDRMVLTHTAVPSEAEGEGVGSALAKAALEHARRERLRVVPRCRFVASWLKRHPEFEDLIADEE